jgi:hypothetical protein
MQIIHHFNSGKAMLGQEASKSKAKGGKLVTLFCHLNHFLNMKWKII